MKGPAAGLGIPAPIGAGVMGLMNSLGPDLLSVIPGDVLGAPLPFPPPDEFVRIDILSMGGPPAPQQQAAPGGPPKIEEISGGPEAATEVKTVVIGGEPGSRGPADMAPVPIYSWRDWPIPGPDYNAPYCNREARARKDCQDRGGGSCRTEQDRLNTLLQDSRAGELWIGVDHFTALLFAARTPCTSGIPMDANAYDVAIFMRCSLEGAERVARAAEALRALAAAEEAAAAAGAGPGASALSAGWRPSATPTPSEWP
eukprot:tig00000681_g3090.t1